MLIANIVSGLVHILVFFRGVASLHFILDNLRELEPDSLAAAYFASRLLLPPPVAGHPDATMGAGAGAGAGAQDGAPVVSAPPAVTPIARLRGQHHHLLQQEKRQQEVGGGGGGGASCGYESPEDDRPPPGMSSALGPRRVQSNPGPGPAPRSNNRTGLRGNSLNGVLSRTKNMRDPGRKVGIRDRIKCFQWTWFTMTMATGGVANVLHSIPFRSRWLTILGLIFFLLNICLFLTNCVLITLRFCWQSGSFITSFTDQVESLFVPAFFVSVATILLTICEYGVPHTGPWLLSAMEVMFWVYVGVSMLASAGIYLVLWSTLVFPIHTMTPIWVFPAYPLLLTAPFGSTLIASAISSQQLEHVNALAISLASMTVQGTGFSIAFMICAAFLYRLMTQKLPRDHQRPGVFISIGPPAFTVSGLLLLGNEAQYIFPNGFMGVTGAAPILKLLSAMVGLWLYGLSIWFFLVSVGSLWKYVMPDRKMPFQMTWFSFVFPNTALVTATIQLGRVFDSRALQIIGCVVAACLIVVWLIVFTYMLRCLWRRELLWPKEVE
ncbi:voltage-dependent anion channel-domain-containing protein [Phialemonium atrogriseum]|uniref:Voltage-dependent anion channel-domain-containing protein n=1 Tax=Phialemonium atrogriseum TaxID=1093897 RepID=A0AAJ0FRG4_9PEZI|nr:voltage-dependent anion channel-domain-containing protein [Phialemonium atrogriseum]KAK1772394.1 voltage-dependent anion channel-domain-containing protein [Phialemonium atrogriseum]